MNNPEYSIQITDLTADAVNKAIGRRKPTEMTVLSIQESQNISGTGIIQDWRIIIGGYLFGEPTNKSS